MSKGIVKDMANENMAFSPNTETFKLPDGRMVTIRERNGEDEDILSKVKNNEDGTAFDKYLYNIIEDLDGNGKATRAQIGSLKNRSKYYILYKSRIQSLGDTVEFEHTFENGDKVSFEEDLKIFDFDWEKQPLEEREEYQIEPYKEKGDSFSFTLSSGVTCKMDYLTSDMEASTLARDISQLSINEKLRIRNFRIADKGGDFFQVENFKMFPSRVMQEIRKYLKEYDSEFTLMTTLKHPSKPIREEVSLFMYPDFFFPKV